MMRPPLSISRARPSERAGIFSPAGVSVALLKIRVTSPPARGSILPAMKLTDQALYEVKNGGRDRYGVAARSNAMPTVVVRGEAFAGA
jgi:hypothetical protein